MTLGVTSEQNVGIVTPEQENGLSTKVAMLTGALSTGTVESSGTEQVSSIIFAGLGDRALLVARDDTEGRGCPGSH